MQKISRLLSQPWDQKIIIIYVLTFITSILFTFFFKKGIEFTRYALIILTIYLIYTNAKIAKPITKSPSFMALTMFFIFAMASLLYNNARLGNIDEVINWTICYLSGFMVFQIMQINAKFVLYIIPISLFSSQIVYPLAIMDQNAIANIFSQNRLDLFFEGKPIHLGIFCGISAFTAASISYFSNHKIIKISYLLLALVSFALLISTGARTSFVGTVLTFLLSILLACWKRTVFFRNLIILFTLVMPILMFAFFSTSSLRTLSITNTSQINKSFLERELIFEIAKDSFYKSPIIGEGFDNFSRIYKREIQNKTENNNFDKQYSFIFTSSNNAHNFSLHFLAETGVLGFFCMNVFWIYIIISGFKSNNEVAKIISGIFLLSYIALQFNMSLYGAQISTLLFSLAGLSGAATQTVRHDDLVALKAHHVLNTHKASQ